MNISNKKRNAGLDIARSFAILLILFSHTLWIGDNYPKLIDGMMRLSGGVGVEIFFCISGFLIGKIVLREILQSDYSFSSIKHFLFRRWFRTFPNYYLFLFMNVMVWYFIYGEFPNKVYKYVFYIQNLTESSDPFYRISWSLPVEQFSYILGPLLLYVLILIFPKKNRKQLFLWVTLFIILVFTASRLYFSQTQTLADINAWNDIVRKVVIYRLDVVYYGFLLRYFYDYSPQLMKRLRSPLALIGVLVLAFLYVVRIPLDINVYTAPTFMIVWYFVLQSLAMAFLINFIVDVEVNSKAVIKFITTISLISYSLYLLHYSIVLHLMKTIFPSESLTGVSLWLYTFLYWGITILLSYLVWRYFEKPITDLRDRPGVLKFLGKRKI